MKTKKTKKSKKQRGNTTHGWGARKKHKKSGHRGGCGMAGTGKRADHKKSLIINLYGNKYFGKQGITSKSTIRKKSKVMNLTGIEKLGKNEVNLKEYKILGHGEINKKIIIRAKSASKSAIEKVKKAGGEIIIEKSPFLKRKILDKEKKLEKDTKNLKEKTEENQS